MGNKNIKNINTIDMIVLDKKRVKLSYRLSVDVVRKRLYIEKFIIKDINEYTTYSQENGELDFLDFYKGKYKHRGLKVKRLDKSFYNTIKPYINEKFIDQLRSL